MNPYVFCNKGHGVYDVHRRGLTVREINAATWIYVCRDRRRWKVIIDGVLVDGHYPTRQAAAEAGMKGKFQKQLRPTVPARRSRHRRNCFTDYILKPVH